MFMEYETSVNSPGRCVEKGSGGTVVGRWNKKGLGTGRTVGYVITSRDEVRHQGGVVVLVGLRGGLQNGGPS